jgi:glutathione S-transferase
MLKVWGRKNSINVQKVLWTCDELGLPWQRIDAGMAFGVNNTPEFLTINPNGLVPVINDSGFILWESHAIMRYLARKHGMGTLWPSDPQVAARADQWMDWYHCTLFPDMRPIFINLVRTPAEKRNMQEVEARHMLLIKNMVILDQVLANQPYVAGQEFSIADIPLGLAVFRWFNMNIERPSMPNIMTWFERLTARPAMKPHMELPLT